MSDPSAIQVPITRLALGQAEEDAVLRVLRSGWLLQGAEVAALEAELGAALGAPHVVAVSSGTAALELALRALGVGPGDEVVTVSHSFIATANAVRAVGARPVFADVLPDTLSLDPEACAHAISRRTRAILCVHQLGFPAELTALGELAAAAGVPLVEDAACALGSEVELDRSWQRLGRPHGRIACFSFHPRKVLTTGEGGAVTTADAGLAERVRALRQHGLMAPAPLDRADGAPDGFACWGSNLRMTDLAAALGRVQLARLPAIVAERRALAAALCAALDGHPVLQAPRERPGTRSNWQSFPVSLRRDAGTAAGWTAAEVARFLAARGIACRRGLTNAHEEPAYTSSPEAWRAGPLPVSEARRRDTLLLPLFHGLRPEELEAITTALTDLKRAAPG